MPENENNVADWRYNTEFREDFQRQDNETPAGDVLKLKAHYPENAVSIVAFLEESLKRRQAIVEKLGDHKSLNDHGFFLLICNMYKLSFRGIGLNKNKILSQMVTFSRHEISNATAERKLKKAVKAGVFFALHTKGDGRKLLYYLHQDMILLCSEAFGGMLEFAQNMKPEEV